MPLRPFDLAAYIRPETQTGDIVHCFYTQQLQIDGGKMDKFVTWSDNGGLVMSYFYATNLPEGKLAQANALCDNFFQAAFGGSFLNHMWLIAAATPVFPNAPAAMVAVPPDAAAKTLRSEVGRIFPLAEAMAAQDLSQTRHGRGRIVLRVLP